jgi:redox-sensitive bicupin YhaK (pirin superfamily)
MPINLRPSDERGLAEMDWLHSQHTFSFADYHDPSQMGFGALRVINEDQIQPGTGFPTHGHQDMEIISYVLKGELEHKDNMGNGSIIRPGEIQRMSAGTGVMHSEYNPSSEVRNKFFQIWIIPEVGGIEPGYEQIEFPDGARDGKLYQIGSRNGDHGGVTIRQDIALYSSILSAGDSVSHTTASNRGIWVQLASGAITVNGVEMKSGDGAAIVDEVAIQITAAETAEFLLFDLAA